MRPPNIKKEGNIKRIEKYTKTSPNGDINKIIFPHDMQVGLPDDRYNSTISGSIHVTREGKSYLVAGSGIVITSGSNGQVTIESIPGEGSEGPAGPAGESGSGISYLLTPASIVLPADNSGTVSDYSPTETDLSLYENGTILDYSSPITANSQWRLVDVIDDGNITYTDGNYTESSDILTFDGHLSNMTADAAIVTYIVQVKNKFGIFSTYNIDQSIAKAKQGSTGPTGPKGDTGDAGPAGTNGTNGTDGSGITIILDPLSVLLSANSSGTVSSYTPSGATIKVYENGTQRLINTSLSANSTWFTVSATGTNITAGTIATQSNGNSYATINDASSMTTDVATIAHVVRVKNSLGVTTDYTVTQTLAKAKSGTNGTNGISPKSVSLTATSTAIQYDANGLNPSPNKIDLVATSQNFVNGYFKFTGGGSSFTDETTYTDGSQANLDTASFTVPASYSSTPYDFRVGVADGNQTELVFDTLTIISSKPGADGAAATSSTVEGHIIKTGDGNYILDHTSVNTAKPVQWGITISDNNTITTIGLTPSNTSMITYSNDAKGEFTFVQGGIYKIDYEFIDIDNTNASTNITATFDAEYYDNSNRTWSSISFLTTPSGASQLKDYLFPYNNVLSTITKSFYLTASVNNIIRFTWKNITANTAQNLKLVDGTSTAKITITKIS